MVGPIGLTFLASSLKIGVCQISLKGPLTNHMGTMCPASSSFYMTDVYINCMCPSKEKANRSSILELQMQSGLPPFGLCMCLCDGTCYGVYALCRIRAGLVVLSHKNKRVSQARLQCCIMRNACVSDPYLHSVLNCEHWASQREVLFAVRSRPGRMNRDAMYALLNICPGETAFDEVVQLSVAIDSAANDFWKLYM